MPRTDRRFALLIASALLALAAGPYLWAWAAAGPDHVFGGLLFNPIDGNTYLAKAYQGYEGDWRFRLPYTAEPGDGAYINLVYIFIGHLARWTGLSIPLAYNLARLAATSLMLVALWAYFKAVFDRPGRYRTACAIAALTLGMGWLLIPAGVVPMDLWVAEAYPLLAALTNPHFPLGLALIAMLANPSAAFTGRSRIVRDAFLALVLGLVSPFGVVIALLPWSGAAIQHALGDLRERSFSLAGFLRRPHTARILAILAGGLPVILYDLSAIRSDPVLALWDEQNRALTPPAWDVALSLSPALILGAAGFRRAPAALRGWFILGLALAFVPVDLQRRFLMGLYIPLAGLAAVGLDSLRSRAVRVLAALAFVPGPLVLLLTAAAGIGSRSPLLYLTAGEHAALEWIEANTDPDALVLAAPETGLFIPAHTGRQVIYGHPFETIDADRTRAAVEAFFSADEQGGPPEALADWGVDFVLYGPREAELGPLPAPGLLQPVFSARGVVIYAVEP